MPDESLILGQLAEEYTARVRQGQLPDLDDYATRHPQLAERIRALFPTLLLLEGLANGTAGATPQAAARLAPGTILGPYRIKREIGRGGMGVVYEAVHQVLDRRVALKVLRAEGLEGGALERFLREAQTAAGLHHTNIVPVFDLGQVGGVPYYAMQLIAGRGLDHVLREQSDPSTVALAAANGNAFKQSLPPAPAQRIAWRLVAEWGVQAADGLAYAHQRGVIHRDIKPSNLLLDAQGIVWITDFGLARRVQDVALTRNGALLGTPRYMSPEQAQAAQLPVDCRTDIYSRGATLYELATGRPAFDAPTPVEVVLAIVERAPAPPRRLEPALPRDLETIILKAMSKRPADRYQDAAELAEDLRRLLRQEPIRARRIGPVGRTVRGCRRNPRLAVASFATVALIALLVASHIVSLHYTNALIAEEKRIAEEHRDTAMANEGMARDALAVSKDHLARSLYEQARAVRSTRQAGRRAKALQLLEWANALRMRPRDTPAAMGALPSAVELRSEALAALLQRDVRLVRELPVLHGTTPTITRDGRRALMHWSKPSVLKLGVHLVDLTDGKELSRFEEESVSNSEGNVVLSDDSTVIAYGTGDIKTAVQLLDPASGDVTHNLRWPQNAPKEFTKHQTYPVFVPGGSLLAGYRNTKTRIGVVVWDLDKDDDEGRLIANLACDRTADTGYHAAIAFNRTGRQLILREGGKGLAVIDMDNPKSVRKFTLPLQTGSHLVRSPRGGLVAVAGIRPDMLQSSLILWDVARGVERARCEGDFAPEGWFPMAFDPDGNFIAVGCIDGSIRIFSTANGKEWLRFGGQFDDPDAQLVWSADGRLIWAGDQGLRIWDVLRDSDLVSVVPVTPPLTAMDVSSDGRWVAMLSGAARDRITLIERATGKQIREWKMPGPLPPVNPLVSFRPDGKQLAVFAERQVMVVDVATGKEVLHREPAGDVRWGTLAFLPDGRLWTAFVKDDAVLVWDITNDREVQRFRHLNLPFLLSPAGRWLLRQPEIGLAMGPYVVSEVATGRDVLRIEINPAVLMINQGVVFCANGSRLLIRENPARADPDAPVPDRGVKVIEVLSGKVLLHFRTIHSSTRPTSAATAVTWHRAMTTAAPGCGTLIGRRS
jgi:serine/threonine protein kinase/WD40 repeat protein